MGRPKSYDRDEILEKAMELFWLHGFHATSTQALVEHMKVNRYSLYAEFGSKQRLYEAALARYDEKVVTRHFGALEAENAGLPEVRAVVESFMAAAGGPGAAYGCFLCNCATERAPHDSSSRQFVDDYVGRMTAAFERVLGNAQRARAIGPDVDVAIEGRFFVAIMLGFFVLLRSQTDPAVVRSACSAALEHLRRLEPTAPPHRLAVSP